MPALPSQPNHAALLGADVRDLVQRSAGVHRGLALLHRAPVESVAVTLGVHPAAVERARAALDSPAQRALAIEEFTRAVQRQRADALASAAPHGVLVYAG